MKNLSAMKRISKYIYGGAKILFNAAQCHLVCLVNLVGGANDPELAWMAPVRRPGCGSRPTTLLLYHDRVLLEKRALVYNNGANGLRELLY